MGSRHSTAQGDNSVEGIKKSESQDEAAKGQEIASKLSVESLRELALNPNTILSFDEIGRIVILHDSGQEVLDDSGVIHEAFPNARQALLDYLNDDREALVALIHASSADALTPETAHDILASPDGSSLFGLNVQETKGALETGQGQFQSRVADGRITGENHIADPLAINTSRWGVDDLQRGELGSRGQVVQTQIGDGLSHLVGLGDEQPGHTNGEKLTSSEVSGFKTTAAGVGEGIEHLWLLGDFDYYRAAGNFGPEDYVHDGGPVYGQLFLGDLTFSVLEDNELIGSLFDELQAVAPASDIRADMDPAFGTVKINPDGTFTYTPLPNFSGIATFDVTLTDPRTGEKLKKTVEVTVGAVADPALISGAAATPEDTLVAIPVTLEMGDKDGSETIESVVISGVPAGAVLGWDPAYDGIITAQPDGTFVISGPVDDTQQLLNSLTLDPPLHFSGQITLGIDVTTIESNVDRNLPGRGDTATVHHDYVIVVEPVADLPPVVAPGPYNTDEDVPVLLAGLDGNLVDVDGSEVLGFEISNVPVGGTFDRGVEIAPGVWAFTPAEVAVGLTFTPPLDEHGTFPMVLTAIATEQANGDEARNDAPFNVIIAPVNDAYDLITPPVSTDEDTAVNFGGGINIVTNDPDGSEVLTQLEVSEVPGGATVTWVVSPGAAVVETIDGVTGEKTYTITGPEAAIRATMATLAITPPADSDVNITLQVTSTVQDGGGPTLQTMSALPVTVAAVADGSNLSGSARGDEDTAIAVPITASLKDTDGSETYEYADVTAPAGNTLSTTALPNGITATAIAGGFRFAPGPATTTAQFEAFLANNIQVTPPGDGDVNFDISVTVGTIESTLSGGEVTLLRTSDATTVPVIVDPVADLPTISGSSLVDEDNTVNFGANINISADDAADGSERITQIEVGGFPAGVVADYAELGGASVAVAVVAGVRAYTITGPDEAGIRSTLASFELDLSQAAYADNADDMTLTVGVTKSDFDDVTGTPDVDTQNGTHAIVVNAVADVPNVTGDTDETTNEDVRVLLDDLAGSLNDTDGSETLSFEIRGVHASAELQNAAGAEYAFVMDGGTKTYAIPVADIDGVYFLNPPHLHGTFNMTIASIATEGTVAGENIADDVAENTAPIQVVVNPVVDVPTLVTPGVATDEDTAVNFGGGINIVTNDPDGSEVLTQLEVSEVPGGATVTWVVSPGAAVVETIDGVTGEKTYTITGPEAAIRATMATLAITPPADSDVNITLQVTSTVQDGGGPTLQTMSALPVTVAAVADGSNLSGSARGDEDTAIAVPITASLKDTDGSETYEYADVTAPAGNTLSTTALPNGITATAIAGGFRFAPGPATTTAQFEAFLANNIQVTPPGDGDVNFDISVTVGTIESTLSGGEVTLLRTSDATTVPVIVDPVADLPTISGSSLVDEDNTVNFGANINISADDAADGSERITQIEVGGFPAGVVADYAELGGASVAVAVVAGVRAYTITGPDEAGIRSTLASFELDLSQAAYADNADDMTLTVGVTKSDFDDVTGTPDVDTQNGTHAIVVNAVADVPNVTGDTDETTNEDVRVLLDDLAGSLNDTDGSETLSFEIRGVHASAELQNAAGAEYAFVMDGGTKTYAIPVADIDGVYFLNPPHLHGTFNMTIASIATEGTVAGENIADDVAENTAPIQVVVNPVVDPPVVTAGGSIVNEDTAFNLGADIGITVDDVDGSQTLSVTLTGIPDPNGNPAPTWTPVAGVTVANPNPGEYTFDGPAADVLTVINSFSITPPTDDDANFTIGVSATTVDNGDPGQTATVNTTHDVVVRAVADAPTVAVSGTGDEDTFIATPVAVTLNDTDGSESLQSVTLTGLPTEVGGTGDASATPAAQIRLVDGAGTVTLNGNFNGTFDGTDAGGNAYRIVGDGTGSLVFTGTTDGIQNALASIEIKRGDHVGDDFNLSATAISVESNPSEADIPVGSEIAVPTANASDTETINVVPITDGITAIAPVSLDSEEDVRVHLAGNGFGSTQVDRDGSEVVTYEISGMPAGSVFRNAGGSIVGTNLGGGTWRFTEAEFAVARFDPPNHQYGDYNMTFTAITDEGEGTSAPRSDSVNFTIRVTPDPDSPRISGSTVVDEDTTVNFGEDITYSLRDADGSEEIVMVRIDQIPAGWTVSFVGGVMPANVTFAGGVYTIVPDAAIPTANDAAQQQSIRDTVDLFRITPPGDSDENVDVRVRVTTEDDPDVIHGDSAFATRTYQHPITTFAVADTPTVSAGAVVTGDEHSDIALSTLLNPITAARADTDGSEVLSVQISGLPAGASIVGDTSGGGAIGRAGAQNYLVTAPSEAQLNAILDSLALRTGDFSGNVQLTVTAISTETGPEISVLQATASDTINVSVLPVVDTPTVKGNAIGLEDTRIEVPISVVLGDKDGSETYTMEITNVPAGARLFGAGGAEIFPVLGVYTLTPADVDALELLPPPNYSSALLDAPINLNARTIVEDTDGVVTASSNFDTIIPVWVTGVADAPSVNPVNISVDEDVAIPLGQGILDSVGGDLNNALTDNDGSETISIVISGLPAGTVPSVGTFIGNGEWQINPADLVALTLPSPPNFSGDYDAFSGLTVRAVTQEIDTDDAPTVVPIDITINPVINTDGFASWTPNATATEDNDIPLVDLVDHVLIDADGSEVVNSYTLDFRTIVADAEISGVVPDALTFVNTYINGAFTNNGDGTITVTPAQLAGLSLDATAFADSNVDFSFPVSAEIQDSGGPTKTENGTFSVDLVGDADIPTVSVQNESGNAGTAISLTLGGDTTDTDTGLGRAQSEDIYYVLAHTNPGASFNFVLVDGANNIVGIDNGDGTFLLRPADLADVRILTNPSSDGTLELTLTTVAVEDDGDLATNTDAFTVDVASVGGPGGVDAPLPPIVTVNNTNTNEDTAAILNVTAMPDPGDTTNPSVALLISNVPAGAEIIGATLNPVTGKYVATGPVQILPPADFSGTLQVTVEGVATNSNLLRATTGEQTADIIVDPVADGVLITAAPDPADEDAAVDLNISLSARDQDVSSPESIQDPVFVRVDSGTLSAGVLQVVGLNAGFYQMTQAELASLQLNPAPDFHGDVTVTVRATSVEPTDDADGDNTQTDEFTFTVDVVADPDPAIVTVPAAIVTGDEDASIVIPGLSAALSDADGSEVLSVTISGVPDGTLFNAGSNLGTGAWQIPVAALATLEITPPLNFAGTMNLSLNAFTLEQSTGLTAQISEAFTVEVTPVADDLEILAQGVTVASEGIATFDLNVRLEDDRGILAGEASPEQVEITFTGVPTSGALWLGSGGQIEDLGGGNWRFLGSETEANDIRFASTLDSDAGTWAIDVSAVTIDGGDTLAAPVTDRFFLTIDPPVVGGQVLTGTGGADVLAGAAGNDLLSGLGGNDTLNGLAGNDTISGGAGAAILSGGAGLDTFVWETGDLGGLPDTISDFNASEGDRLDVSDLLIGFNPVTSALSDFVRLTEAAGDTTVSIDVNGGGDSFTDVVVLDNVTGLDLDALRDTGNLIVA